MGKSYSLAGMRTEAYALYSRARSLAEDALKKFQGAGAGDQVYSEHNHVLSYSSFIAFNLLELN